MPITIPDSKLVYEITEFIHEETTALLFNHSSRVYCFANLHGQKHGMKFDAELLYAGAMFHDLGLMPKHRSPNERFEVDGANKAKEFYLREEFGKLILPPSGPPSRFMRRPESPATWLQ